MKILVTNDDGIRAKGIKVLSDAARLFGDVVVVAPIEQCSAMSQRITLGSSMELKKISEEPGTEKLGSITRYSLTGTPADCVRVATGYLMPQKPDFVFSGVNHGHNMGFDLSYSGTACAAVEGILQHIPAAAFSSSFSDNMECCEEYLPKVIELLLGYERSDSFIWNVNVPDCAPDKCKGILENRTVARQPYFADNYYAVDADEKYDKTMRGFPEGSDTVRVMAEGYPAVSAPKGTDIEAVFDNYISIGKLIPLVLK